eukprot:6478200-Amphidinium_carterae.1
MPSRTCRWKMQRLRCCWARNWQSIDSIKYCEFAVEAVEEIARHGVSNVCGEELEIQFQKLDCWRCFVAKLGELSI